MQTFELTLMLYVRFAECANTHKTSLLLQAGQLLQDRLLFQCLAQRAIHSYCWDSGGALLEFTLGNSMEKRFITKF